MSEPITIPANADLPRAMGADTWSHLKAWFAANGVLAGQVTAQRPVVMTDESIDRWEIVGSNSEPRAATLNVSRRGDYRLAEGEEWTNDSESAIAIHHVASLIAEPLPDDLRAALVAAIG